ncbi:PEP-CTERM sorting domain-containing protein [Kamptonema sp. UHCC 0994]|uniref:PEP-CTERM sorting domain-containing protein n=1 Tax=Kamptonema sp. UHCC 0994 TaxID=3031329 RepID=UPI0023B94AF4|nr:PEP-CTERM sorting domain-containing protein [Kamptonema sp. UHCC 0994]MDF0552299.1 PEP-CTERM sorting domain-containing protein [Kamptonema sp. UHCC 0994]
MKTIDLTKLTAAAAAAVTAMLSMTTSANAATFGTTGISFDQDTTVNFTFLKSQGAALSSLGVYDANQVLIKNLFTKANTADAGYQGNSYGTDSWLGTASNLVGSATTNFTFLANQVYSLGLSGTLWGNVMKTVFSTSSQNGGSQQAVFNSTGGSEGVGYDAAGSQTSASPFGDPVAISFEDTLSGDSDYNDFTVSAQAVPEPITMAGMALGAGGMAIARRRRNRKTA